MSGLSVDIFNIEPPEDLETKSSSDDTELSLARLSEKELVPRIKPGVKGKMTMTLVMCMKNGNVLFVVYHVMILMSIIDSFYISFRLRISFVLNMLIKLSILILSNLSQNYTQSN